VKACAAVGVMLVREIMVEWSSELLASTDRVRDAGVTTSEISEKPEGDMGTITASSPKSSVALNSPGSLYTASEVTAVVEPLGEETLVTVMLVPVSLKVVSEVYWR